MTLSDLLDDVAEQLEARGSALAAEVDRESAGLQGLELLNEPLEEQLDDSGFDDDVMSRDPRVADEMLPRPMVNPYEGVI